jgi:hypothetical protein
MNIIRIFLLVISFINIGCGIWKWTHGLPDFDERVMSLLFLILLNVTKEEK